MHRHIKVILKNNILHFFIFIFFKQIKKPNYIKHYKNRATIKIIFT